MKEKIKELFSMLPRAEQLELLRDLNCIKVDNPISEVNEICQVQFNKNAKFQIENLGSDGRPDIKVTLITPWGTFSDTAINKKIAKAKVSEMALAKLGEVIE